VNSVWALPLHGNRLIEGWQLSGILAGNTGLPFNVTDGVDQSNQINGVPRPNYAPNNPAATVNGISYPACNNRPIVGTVGLWFNPNCFTPETFGTLGNFAREGLYGPGLVNLDIAVLKNTKLRENWNLQVRAQFFNILNHTNLSYPGSSGSAGSNPATIFTGTPSPNAVLGRNATAGQILTYAAPSREIQFGLKLLF
jgi:hypothetical protein